MRFNVGITFGIPLALLLLCLLTGCGAGGTTPPAVKANANIAFMGDSITYGWGVPTTNFGISGNTTTQMRNRFAYDVLGHGYKAVVILGGTNDMRDLDQSLTGGVSEAAANIEAMAAAAKAEKMLVVLCKIPPIVDLDDRAIAMNTAIAALANANHYPLVDYYTPMVGHSDYFVDGIHPNAEGYYVMQLALANVLPLNY